MALSRTVRVNLLIGNGHFLSHFYSLCLPPLFVAWEQAFHVSFAELGLSVALMSATTALLQTPVGFLVDRHGARHFLIGGALLMSLSMAAMSLASSFWQILALALLSGVGNSVFHPADYAIISGSVDGERMGRSFALHTFAGNLGFAAAPPVMAVLAVTLGWRSSLLLVGLAGIAVAAAIVLQSGILQDQARPAVKHAAAVSGRALLLNRTMLLFLGFYLLGSMAGTGIQAWLITVLHEVKGVALAVASAALTAYMVGCTLGVLAGGWASDAFKRLMMAFTVAAILAAAAVVAAVGVLPMPGVAAVAAMFVAGLLTGCSRTPRDVMLKNAAPAGQIGKVFGFVSAGLPLGSALTPVPFGFLIDRGHPEAILLLVAVLLVASVLCLAAARATVATRQAAVAAAE